MYCRTCGNKMNDNAELCVKCGVRKNVGTDYCQVCGARTTASMTTCKKCGAKLMKALSSAQIKKKAVSKGKKTLGTVILVMGLIVLFAACANLFVGLTARSTYSSMSSMSTASYCGIIGGFLTGLGIKLRKK